MGRKVSELQAECLKRLLREKNVESSVRSDIRRAA